MVAFISAYVVGGLEGHYYPSLYGPDGVDVKATIQVIEANRDIVKGIKAMPRSAAISAGAMR